MFYSAFTSRIRDFSNRDEGAATEWSIMWTVIFLVIGGLAIDYTYALRTHHMLQTTADAASTAGAVQLWEGGSVNNEAIKYSRFNMPRGLNGNVLLTNDIYVGTWDHVNKKFTQTGVNPDAVKVQTRRMASNGNSLPTMLLKLVGFGDFDIASESVTHLLMNPACLDNGIIANGMVDMASNNVYKEFCVHGFDGIDLQMGSNFIGKYHAADGTEYPILTVGSPYDANGDPLPMSQWLSGANYATMLQNNTGLAGNFGTRPGFKSRAAQNVATYINNLYDPVNPTAQQVANFTILATKADFDALNQNTMSGSYYATCNGGQKLTIDPPSKIFSDVTLVTNCKLHIGQDVTLANVDLATTKTGSNTVTMANDVSLGGDVCDELNGTINGTPAQSNILSMGDIHAASGFSVYGSKMISAQDIHFAAKSGGINGASIQADGDVFLASNANYSAGPCKVPLDDDYIAPYWRIVR